MLLDVKNIDVLYDDFQVIWDISINVNKGEMVALLGPNGSGKSTILNTISNLVHHRNGSIHFENNLISEIPTHKRTELGISHVLERRRVFPHLTVMQNLLLGAWHPKAKEQLDNSLSKIYKIFPKLEVRSSQLARTMSGGEQQMLTTARALCLRPKVLLLDEPTEGLQPSMIDLIIEVIVKMKAEGFAIVLVEQRVDTVLSLADRAIFIENGKSVDSVTPTELALASEKITKYLGV